MDILNTTNVSLELVKAIALDVGLDLSQAGILELKHLEGDNAGEFYSYAYKGQVYYTIELKPWASTEIVAHELRHMAQCLMMGGFDILDVINEIENETEGYTDNVLEEDAREAGKRWKV